MTGEAPLPKDDDVRPLPLAYETLAMRLRSLPRGARLTVVGLGRDRLYALVQAEPRPHRHMLIVDRARVAGASGVIDRVLDDLAAIASELWPDWPLPPEPSAWHAAASKAAAEGRPPRFRRLGPDRETAVLLRLMEPAGVTVLAEIDPASHTRAAPLVAALEYLSRRGAATVALLAVLPPWMPPYDRLLYGAVALEPAPEPVAERFVPANARPHPMSATERRLALALDQDPELAPLFSGNVLVDLGPHARARVDLLWAEGRVVVEIDGPEHRSALRYGEDRHRDYELIIAGYVVLRLTNEQVETDLARAVEKIRAVVRLRRPSSGPATS